MNKEELVLLLIDKLLNSTSNDEVKKEENNNLLGTSLIGKYVILRGYNSGVHFGKLEYASPGLYRLSDTRRLWRWTAKQSIGLSGVAQYGIKESDYCKICPTLALIEITDNAVSEIIPCTDESIKSIQEHPVFNP